MSRVRLPWFFFAFPWSSFVTYQPFTSLSSLFRSHNAVQDFPLANPVFIFQLPHLLLSQTTIPRLTAYCLLTPTLRLIFSTPFASSALCAVLRAVTHANGIILLLLLLSALAISSLTTLTGRFGGRLRADGLGVAARFVVQAGGGIVGGVLLGSGGRHFDV